MDTTTKGIPSALICWTFNEYGKSEQRQNVDALKAWQAIEPHLDGTWKMIDSRIDDTTVTKHCRWAAFERVSDGLRLSISAVNGKRYGVEHGICVSPGHYKASGEDIDLRYLGGGCNGWTIPRAEIDITKRSAKAIANDIARRVIAPLAEKLPRIKEVIAEREDRESARDKAIAKLKRIDGVTVRQQPNSREVNVNVGKAHGRMQNDGGLRLEYFYLDAEHVEAFARFMVKLGK